MAGQGVLLEAALIAMSEPYAFRTRIHGGRMAAVYRAVTRDESETAVAVKIVAGYGRVSESKPPREVAMLLRLRAHPCIVSLLAWYPLKEAKSFAIAMPFIEIDDFDVSREPGKLVKYMWDVCQALVFCQEVGVLIRDVKNSNILFDAARQRAILIDFDCATLYDPDKPPTDLVGTRGYLAPEVADKETRANGYGFPVDAYGAGVSFYTLVFHLPYARVSSLSPDDIQVHLTAAISASSAAPDPAFRASLLALLTTLLDPNPSSRATPESALSMPIFSSIRRRKGRSKHKRRRRPKR